MSWMTRLAGSVGRMGLAGEDDLDRAIRVAHEPLEAVHVAEDHRGPLVRREAAGEADRQARRVERRASSSVSVRRRLTVTAELAAQPPAGEDRELELLALMGLPQLVVGDRDRGVPTSGWCRSCRRGRRGPHRDTARAGRARGEPSQVGGWTPLVMPRIGRSMTAVPGRVGRRRVELAHRVRPVREAEAERGHVELPLVAVDAPADLEDAVERARRRSRAGRRRRRAARPPGGRDRPRSARCPPRPGVWIVKTLSRFTRANGVVEVGPRRRRARASVRRGGRR